MTINDVKDETTPNASPPSVAPAAPKWLATLGLVAGLGAVIASSCCVIPLGLAAIGAGRAFSAALNYSPNGASRSYPSAPWPLLEDGPHGG